MTTITREQLIKRAQARLELMQEAAREFSESPNAQMDLRLAEIALASLDGEPRLHIKEQPVPELAAIVERLNLSGYEYEGGEVTPQNAASIVDTLLQQLDDAVQCRNAHPVQVVPEELAKAFISAIEKEQDRLFGEDYLMDSKDCIDVIREEAQRLNACRAAMLQGKLRDLSQPVDPQVAEYEQIMLQAGWVMVPVEPTDEMIAAAIECEGVIFDSKDPTAFCVQYWEIYCAMVDAAPKPEGNNG
ncbi:TPA: hypothetical protein ACGAJ1_002328 [Salmonella enterica subsp. enterica serovar Newport]